MISILLRLVAMVYTNFTRHSVAISYAWTELTDPEEGGERPQRKPHRKAPKHVMEYFQTILLLHSDELHDRRSR
jgi:hypothetical protein